MSEKNQPRERKISDNLAPVIAAVAERIHYAESRRTNYTVMAAALIAASLTILTFAAGFDEREWLRDGALTGSFGLLITGAFILYKFGVQTNRYPYTSATKTWKWFYRDALPDNTGFDLKWWQRWGMQKARVKAAYTAQLPQFKERLGALESDQTNLEQDMEQLYSLHINEKYKNLYLSSLRTIFNRGLAVTLLFAILGMVTCH